MTIEKISKELKNLEESVLKQQIKDSLTWSFSLTLLNLEEWKKVLQNVSL